MYVFIHVDVSVYTHSVVVRHTVGSLTFFEVCTATLSLSLGNKIAHTNGNGVCCCSCIFFTVFFLSAAHNEILANYTKRLLVRLYIETISYYKMNAALSTKGESVFLLDCLSTINGRNTYFDMSANTIKILLAIEVNFFRQNQIKTDLKSLT